MANPLFSEMGENTNSMAELIRRTKEFKKTFTGNPRDEVQRLLNTGMMSQSEFNQFSQIAQQVVQAMEEN